MKDYFEMQKSAFEQWEAGDLAPDIALVKLCNQLASLEDSIGPLEQSKQVVRDHISRIVEYVGGKITIAGIGTMVNTGPAQTVSYDAKKLDGLIVKLTAQGQGDLARLLADCRKEGFRAGSLRVSFENRGKGSKE